MDNEHICEVGEGATENIVMLSSCRIKPRRVKLAARKVKQKKSKLLGCNSLCHLKYFNTASSLSTTSNDQDSIPSIPYHAIFVFLDPILVGVMQVEFQNKAESPFKTYSVQMQVFLTAICIYSALLGMQMAVKKKGCQSGHPQAQVLNYALLFFGALSSASLLSILLQPQVLLVVLFVWGSIPIVLAHHSLKSSACWMIEMVAKLIWDVCNCKFATVVVLAPAGNNTTCPTERVEGIL